MPAIKTPDVLPSTHEHGKWITLSGATGMGGHRVFINKRGQIILGGVPKWLLGTFLCPEDLKDGEETIADRAKRYRNKKLKDPSVPVTVSGDKKVQPKDTKTLYSRLELRKLRQTLQEDMDKNRDGEWENISHKFGNKKKLEQALAQADSGIIVKVKNNADKTKNGLWKKMKNGRWTSKRHRSYAYADALLASGSDIYVKQEGFDKIFHTESPRKKKALGKSFGIGFWRQTSS